MKNYIKVIPSDLLSKSKPLSKFGKFIQFPIVRIFIAILFLIPIIAASNIVSFLYDSVGEPINSILSILRYITTILLLLLIYQFYTKIIEKREAHEISMNNSFSEFVVGFSISLLLVTGIVSTMSLLGYYKVESHETFLLLLRNFLFFGMGALTQTIIFRIIIFKNIEELTGTWIALMLGTSIFGIAHMFNENASIINLLSLMCSDLMLVGSFVLTRRIWMVWGLHASWNFFQAGVFGMPNSGIIFKGFLKPNITGPNWLSGGEFGIEASILSLIVNIIIGIIIIFLAIKMKQTVKLKRRR